MQNPRSDFNEMYSHINTPDTQQDDVFFPFARLVVVVCDKFNTHRFNPSLHPPKKKSFFQTAFTDRMCFLDTDTSVDELNWPSRVDLVGDPADPAHMLLI